MYLNDSKQVSASRRDELFDEIQEKAIASAVGIVSPQRIDEINILQATYEAMHQAVERLKVTPDLLLVDAVTIPAMPMKQVGIIKGDAKSVSIAAASILAKVTRDRMMVEYDASIRSMALQSTRVMVPKCTLRRSGNMVPVRFTEGPLLRTFIRIVQKIM